MFKKIIDVLTGNQKNDQIENDNRVSCIPDSPCQFGYNTSWFAVKCDSPMKVIESFKLKIISECNWSSGIGAVYENEKIFVSPCLDGFILVVGMMMDTDIEKILSISSEFSEYQYFASHNVTGCHTWVKVIDRKLARAYTFVEESGEVLCDEGEMTSEEKALGFEEYPSAIRQIYDWDEDEFHDTPNEESVLKIAGEWGIDTSFQKKNYPKATGFVCSKQAF